MAAYIGQNVSLQLIDDQSYLRGCLITHDPKTGKITLAKVTQVKSDGSSLKLPGNQVYFQDDIVPHSLKIQDEFNNESSTVAGDLQKTNRRRRTLEQRGDKGDNPQLQHMQDYDRGKIDISAVISSLCKSDDENLNACDPITSLQYKRLDRLVTRDEWQNSICETRPKCFFIVDSLGPEFDEVINRIKHEKEIGLAVEGGNISREGNLYWVQVAASDVVYLFDVNMMGHKCISYGLGEILESSTILKVTHDCRFLSDLLYHQYQIQLRNIFDTQVVAVLVYRAAKGALPAYVTSLQHLVQNYLPQVKDEYHVHRINLAFQNEDAEIWANCRAYPYLLDNLAKRASYLVELQKSLMNQLLRDFYIGIDAYVSVVRDISQQEYDREKLEDSKHKVPEVFKAMETRDHRSHIPSSYDTGEHRVDSSTGFIENIDDPQDIVFKRDSVWHSKQRKEHNNSGHPARKPTTTYKYDCLTPEQAATLNKAAKKVATLKLKPVSSYLNDDKPDKASGDRLNNEVPAKNNPEKSTPSSPQLSSPVQPSQTSPAQSSPGQSPHQQYTMRGINGIHNSPTRPAVGRGRRISSPHTVSSEDEVFIPRPLHKNHKHHEPSPLAMLSSTEVIQDSDSGVESGPLKALQTANLGVLQGFQNHEMMGTPIDLNNLPPDFDIRSACHDDLLKLRSGQFESKVEQNPKFTAHHIPVVRHEISSDGTIHDLESGAHYHKPVQQPINSSTESSQQCSENSTRMVVPGKGRGLLYALQSSTQLSPGKTFELADVSSNQPHAGLSTINPSMSSRANSHIRDSTDLFTSATGNKYECAIDEEEWDP